MLSVTLLALPMVLVAVRATTIPSYIHLCKRSDPQLDSCIKESVESIRPYLRDGIPEMGVPPMEPMTLPEIVISKTAGFKAIATDVVMHGATQFELQSLKTKVEGDKVQVDILMLMPKMDFDAQYEVSGKIMVLPLNGKGPISASATNVEGKASLKAVVIKDDDDKRKLKFHTLDLKLRIPNYTVKMDNLFGGDKALGDAINIALNENKKQVMRVLGPSFEKATASILLETANKIAERYEFDELFPL